MYDKPFVTITNQYSHIGSHLTFNRRAWDLINSKKVVILITTDGIRVNTHIGIDSNKRVYTISKSGSTVIETLPNSYEGIYDIYEEDSTSFLLIKRDNK